MSIDWNQILEKFKEDALEGYKKHEMANRISNLVHVSTRPATTIMRLDHPVQAQVLLEGEMYVDENPMRSVPANPYQVGFKVNLSKVKNEIDYFTETTYMRIQGTYMAEREYRAIIESIVNDADTKLSFSTDQIKEDQVKAATDSFSQGLFSWDMVVDRKIFTDLEQSKQFIPKWELDRRGISHPDVYHFIGKYSWLNVYDAPFLEEKAVLYDKSEIHVVQTEPSCFFDNDNSPNWFTLDKQVTSGAVVKQAVAIIDLS